MAHATTASEGSNLTGWLVGLLVIVLVVAVAGAFWVMYHGA